MIVCRLGSWVGFVGIIFSLFCKVIVLISAFVTVCFLFTPLTEAVARCVCRVGTLFGCPVIENSSYFRPFD